MLAAARHILHKASPFIGLAAFGLALFVLHDWLRPQHYHDLRSAVSAMPWSALIKATALAAAAYVVLAGYDLLALRFIGRRLDTSSIVTTAFLANALGNNFGNTLITGAAVRYWTYTAAGMAAPEIARVVLFCAVGFWLGFLFVGGTVFVFFPVPVPAVLHWAGPTTQPLGGAFYSALAVYLLLVAAHERRRLVLRRFKPPSLALTVGQIAVASADLCLMASVFYVLLPASAGVGFSSCLAALLLALVAGNASLVPGGLGVFESAVVLLLGPQVRTVDLGGALLVFRLLYFIAPLGIAGMLVASRAGMGRPAALATRARRRTQAMAMIAPTVFAAIAFVAGALLLLTGSVPSSAGRLDVLRRTLSLSVIEISHFVASLIGAVLLLLARALQRRLDAAWYAAALLLGTASVLSLLRGGTIGLSVMLVAACLVLIAVREQFYRRSSLLGQTFTPAWGMAIAMVLIASAWLILFAHGHALYSGQSWWTFALHAEASRSLRALVGASGLLVLFGWYRLLRPLRPRIPSPEKADFAHAHALIARSSATYANLALRGDKALLFSARGDAFLMYGRSGRSWVAMGDPIGSDNGARELLWQFHDLCDRFDGWCVFFEVGDKLRVQYAELGLAMTPLGEEARVPLADFSIDAPSRKWLRHARAQLLRRGCTFEILPREAVPAALPALAKVSSAWLAGKATREKGFSNASFDAHYLEQFPVAIVRIGGEIVAFANLWLGANQEELSIDLMRHLPTAPHGTMDWLFCELMLWGRAQGYHWFNLGMTPLAGLDAQAQAPIWRHVGTWLYQHGEHFYHFRGLRHYKAKFDPVWRPLYLASPGGVALPAVLVDVSALMAGGLLGIVSGHGAAAQPQPCDAF